LTRMSNWTSNELKEDLTHILVNSLIISLDRFLLQGKFEEFYELYEDKKEWFLQD